MFDIFFKDLILEFVDLILRPEHRDVTEIYDLHVWVPEGVFTFQELMQDKGRKHQVF